MKKIINDKKVTYVINKSSFIGMVCQVDSLQKIDNKLEEIKKEYQDATHICYAYILPYSKKYTDDNEPIGCAGKPILEVLEKHNLNYVLGIVIRYFGGIKLGSNGLIRAYSNSIKNALINNTKDIEEGFLIKITENYKKSKELDYLLNDSNIISKNYQEKIMIEAIINKKTLDSLSNVHYEIIKKVII